MFIIDKVKNYNINRESFFEAENPTIKIRVKNQMITQSYARIEVY